MSTRLSPKDHATRNLLSGEFEKGSQPPKFCTKVPLDSRFRNEAGSPLATILRLDETFYDCTHRPNNSPRLSQQATTLFPTRLPYIAPFPTPRKTSQVWVPKVTQRPSANTRTTYPLLPPPKNTVTHTQPQTHLKTPKFPKPTRNPRWIPVHIFPPHINLSPHDQPLDSSSHRTSLTVPIKQIS